VRIDALGGIFAGSLAAYIIYGPSGACNPKAPLSCV